MADAGSKVLRGLLDVFLLESLEQQPKHGYALLREMADAFGTEPNRNRLYPLLGRMVGDGLIAERSEPSGTRTLYALTDAGRDVLAGYRDLPLGFHERLARIWGPTFTRVAPSPPLEGRSSPTAAAPTPLARELAAVNSTRPSNADGELPYPCPDARIALERSPRTGDLSMTLTGCPMGAYEYCPLCPVAKSIEGVRRLTFL